MDPTVRASFPPHDDPDASLACYRSDRDDAERDGKRAGPFVAGVRRPRRGSPAGSVPATVRPLPSPEVKRLGLVRRTEVLRNG